MGGIHRQTDLNIVVEDKGSERSSQDAPQSMFGDDVPLRERVVQAHTTYQV
jgi:hypothetical protein